MTNISSTTPPDALLNHVSYIESVLKESIESFSLPKNLEEATMYAVMNGGKRVRPALTLLCCEAAGGSIESAIQAAIAVEFIHCFSLVHDDLPAIDNDDLRRGKPTLHIETNEAMAILAGDNLLTLAFLQITNAHFDTEQKALICNRIAEATKNMVVGQVYDTLGGFSNHTDSQERVELVHQNKTGALIQCACELGAICGHGNAEKTAALKTYGNAIGLMFQIVDDFIDLHGDEEHVGKATGKDHGAGKLTYPSAIGVEASKKAIQTLKSQADVALSIFGEEAETLRSFNLWLAHRTR